MSRQATLQTNIDCKGVDMLSEGSLKLVILALEFLAVMFCLPVFRQTSRWFAVAALFAGYGGLAVWVFLFPIVR